MLFALLYNQQDEIVAAALACDQLVMGESYWRECHPAGIEPEEFQTAYINVIDPAIQQRLKWLGVDKTIDQREVTNWVESSVCPEYRQFKVA